jgi:hypothetical protein
MRYTEARDILSSCATSSGVMRSITYTASFSAALNIRGTRPIGAQEKSFVLRKNDNLRHTERHR